MRKPLLLIALALLVVVGGLALTPPAFWWTGRVPAPSLALVAGGPDVAPFGRVWIDTDAACGAGPRTDPDDCFAILWLVAHRIDVVGVSTSFGNAPGAVVTDRLGKLADRMSKAGLPLPPILEGHAAPASATTPTEPPGVTGLRAALEDGPLTILALGPLTNLAAALEGRPDLHANVQRIVAVMGHEAGHIFHPTEGQGPGTGLGHGPIFRDLNVAVDVDAVPAVLALDLPMTLIPYDAGRGTMITGTDLNSFAQQGPVQNWLSQDAEGWLAFWQDDIGMEGFSPFDWVAAVYLADPTLFDCAPVQAEVRREWALWLVPRKGLVVERAEGPSTILYCPRTSPRLHALLLSPP